jgi:hypothetical protein
VRCDYFHWDEAAGGVLGFQVTERIKQEPTREIKKITLDTKQQHDMIQPEEKAKNKNE